MKILRRKYKANGLRINLHIFYIVFSIPSNSFFFFFTQSFLYNYPKTLDDAQSNKHLGRIRSEFSERFWTERLSWDCKNICPHSTTIHP